MLKMVTFYIIFIYHNKNWEKYISMTSLNIVTVGVSLVVPSSDTSDEYLHLRLSFPCMPAAGLTSDPTEDSTNFPLETDEL